MGEQTKTRRQKLEELLAKNPTDAFTLYGLALECKNGGDFPAAEGYFRTLLKTNPEYVPGYQMYAQGLAQGGRVEDAIGVLTQGIAAAQRSGNSHAMAEMEGLLAELK
jgi:predicted Zn-dependent protease